MQFTDKYILNLKPLDKKYYKREARGFAIRVMPSGVKTFLYVYKVNDKGRQELNLGEYPYTTLAGAREKYQAAYTLVSKGVDPKEQIKAVEEAKEKARNTTFKHFSDEYLRWSEQHHTQAGYKINKLSLENDVLPFWQDRDISGISRRDAIELLERVAHRAPGQAGNVQRAARGVFGYALEREYIPANPMLGLSKVVPALKQVPRERILTDAEIIQLWPTLPPYLQLILLTAQRPGEVAGIHTREIQIGINKPWCATCRRCGWWTIPPERTKSGKEHMVYLTVSALKLISDLDGYVFPSPKSDSLDKPIERMALSRYVHRHNYNNLPRWTPHDLRRTARTHMARIGIIDEHAEAVLAHCKQGIKKVYNKYEYQEEKKSALLKWEEELLKIIS